MSEPVRNTRMTAKERHHLKSFIKEIENHKGRGTELVSVYVPAGYDLNKINAHLAQEQGTASNIKSKQTRDNVINALEKMIQHLKLFDKTPEHGLAAFAGNVAEREGQQDHQVWSIEPPVPLNTRIYRCDKEFVLEPLRDIIADKEVYGLVVMDRRDAALAILKGKSIIPLAKTHSEVAGKTRAGGQCLFKDSIVQIADGSLVTISSLHNSYIVKAADTFKGELLDSPITDKWDVKKKQVYQITTSSPRLQVEASADHTFFVATKNGIKEKKAGDLTSDDLLVMPEKIVVQGKKQLIKAEKYYNGFILSKKGRDILKHERMKNNLSQKAFAKKISVTQTTISTFELGKRNLTKVLLEKICQYFNIPFQEFLEQHTKPSVRTNMLLPTELSPLLAQFVGYLIGDGCIEKDRISFFEQNKSVAMNYKKLFDNYFNMNSSYTFKPSKNYHQLRFTSRPLVRLLQKEFPEIKKARNSRIPKKILQSPDKVFAAFLKGLFDAEGYINERGVGLGINNKQLAQELQMALLRFSIISSLHEYDNRVNKYSDNPRFTIDISEKQSLQLFKRNISFSALKKSSTLDSCLKQKTNKSNVRQIIVSGTKIRKLIEQAGYNLQLFPKVNNFFRDERMMSKEVFKSSIIKQVKDKKLLMKLQEIYNNSLLPVKVASIKKGKIVSMTDISVKNQNFIANGLLVHNSAQRFERLREGATKDHYKKVADYMKDQFLFMEGLKGIILGGPSTTTNDFLNKDYVTGDLKKKIIAVKDLSYTGDFGLQELLERSQDVLAEEDVAQEKELMQKFFSLLAKNADVVSYGVAATQRALELGAVDTLLLSEDLSDKEIAAFEEKADQLGSTVEIISVDTREGVQLRDMGKVVAILRFPLQS